MQLVYSERPITLCRRHFQTSTEHARHFDQHLALKQFFLSRMKPEVLRVPCLDTACREASGRSFRLMAIIFFQENDFYVFPRERR